MIGLTLAEIAAVTGGVLDLADPGTVVTGPVVIDSRRAGPGGLFAALPGERADGHDYAPAAVAAGPPGCSPPGRCPARPRSSSPT